MEGISHEAASFAGHNKLSKLVVLYDSNDISLDGELNKAFSENTKARFEAYGWNYLLVKDGNDLEEIDKAIVTARSSKKDQRLLKLKQQSDLVHRIKQELMVFMGTFR